MKNLSFASAGYSFLILLIYNTSVFSIDERISNSNISAHLSPDTNTTYTLKVLLVEFADIRHRNPKDDNKPAYKIQDFNNLFFSKGVYVSPNMFSPDNENVFGSLHDYYDIISNGNLKIEGYVLNRDTNIKGVPQWIRLEQNKSYYQDKRPRVFYNAAIKQARKAGLNIEGLGGSTKLVIIYAGQMYRRKSNGEDEPCGLTPIASRSNNYYVMSEQFAPGEDFHIEDSARTFSHIGVHAHEFAHLLGCNDHYGKVNNNGKWDLMGSGGFNGPEGKGACPAPLNPSYRWDFGWINVDTIDTNKLFDTKKLDYSLRNPEVYQLRYRRNRYFLIEYRKFDAKMTIGNHVTRDYNSYVVWMRKNEGVLGWRAGNIIQLLYADGDQELNRDGDVFPGRNNVRVLTPWSDNRRIKSGTYWLPNTKNSINCGMEIVSDEPGNYVINLYEKNPEYASPSKPKNLKFVDRNNVSISWEANTEPDIEFYNIYKKDAGDSEFSFIGRAGESKYIDETEYAGTASDKTEYVYYYVTAFDSQKKESVPSEIIEVLTAVVPEDDVLTKSLETENVLYSFELKQNYPNPFNPTTTIDYSVPAESDVSLIIYNLIGQEIATLVNEYKIAGNYSVNWDASGLASGTYIYRLISGGTSATKKMVLLK